MSMIAAALACLTAGLSSVAAGADVQSMVVFDRVPVEWSEDAPSTRPSDPYIIREQGQEAERTLMLPPAPADQRNARKIIAVVTVSPQIIDMGDQVRIADPWTRLGYLSVVIPGETEGEAREIEIMRFVTGFGGESTFEQDVTAYAPVLAGRTTLRARILTWMQPAWEITVELRFHDNEAGYRRPVHARPVLTQQFYTSRSSERQGDITMPHGLALPRIQVFSTGHGGQQEFASADHILRIDGKEIARWRPWREGGGELHMANPTSRRFEIEGRELWSSDVDRAGWLPGDIVRPMKIPAPELMRPGKHTIELEIAGIRPMPEGVTEPLDGHFWVVSLNVVADEPWPPPPQEEEAPANTGSGDDG